MQSNESDWNKKG